MKKRIVSCFVVVCVAIAIWAVASRSSAPGACTDASPLQEDTGTTKSLKDQHIPQIPEVDDPTSQQRTSLAAPALVITVTDEKLQPLSNAICRWSDLSAPDFLVYTFGGWLIGSQKTTNLLTLLETAALIQIQPLMSVASQSYGLVVLDSAHRGLWFLH
jgi:hypothetical protein